MKTGPRLSVLNLLPRWWATRDGPCPLVFSVPKPRIGSPGTLHVFLERKETHSKKHQVLLTWAWDVTAIGRCQTHRADLTPPGGMHWICYRHVCVVRWPSSWWSLFSLSSQWFWPLFIDNDHSRRSEGVVGFEIPAPETIPLLLVKRRRIRSKTPCHASQCKKAAVGQEDC